MSTYPLTLPYEEACRLCKLEADNLKARSDKDLLRFVDVSAPGFEPAPYGVPLADMSKPERNFFQEKLYESSDLWRAWFYRTTFERYAKGCRT